MKLTVKPELRSSVLRNEKSAIVGQFWFEGIEVETIGNGKKKVSFSEGDKLSGYIVVDEVEFKAPILHEE